MKRKRLLQDNQNGRFLILSNMVRELTNFKRVCGDNGITVFVDEPSLLRTTFLGNLEMIHSDKPRFTKGIAEFDSVNLLLITAEDCLISVDLIEFDEDSIELKVGSGTVEEGYLDVEYFTVRSEDDFGEFEKELVDYITHVKSILLD